jgi:hypothetical protein
MAEFEEQPYDDRHNTPPAPSNPFQWVPPIAPPEGAMNRFAELPAQADDNARSTANREARLAAHVDTTDVTQSINYLRDRLPNDTERYRPFNACLRTVLDELTKRMSDDVTTLEPTEDYPEFKTLDDVPPAGLQWFFGTGDHVTNVARWATEGHPDNQSTLDLRVLSAHLTTALDGIGAELNRRLAHGK